MKFDPTKTDGAEPDLTFVRSMERVEGLVAEIERLQDPHVRNLARGLTQALLDLHGNALDKMLSLAEHSEASGVTCRQNWLDDPLVSNVLVLHGLHPVDVHERVVMALEKVRPRLSAQDAEVTLLAIREDTVELRLVSHAPGCHSTGQTLRRMVEDALVESAADVASVIWDDTANDRPTPAFVPLARLSAK